jgi:hypothetical protein
MLGVFEFIISIIFIFLLVVYVIYTDIKSEVNSSSTKDYTDTCKRKCTKPTKVSGTCYHPIKYNSVLKKNQEIKSQLICPWQCSSGYSDDPNTCRYDDDCSGCSPTVSFPNVDSKCPNSTYGCCGDGKTQKTDEFGNNCLGVTGCTGSTGLTGSTGSTGATGGHCFEGFSVDGLEEMVSSDNDKNNNNNNNNNNESNKFNQQSIPNKTMYPTCPNIQCPNESAFQKDDSVKRDVSLGTLPPYPWPVVTDYTTFGV